MKIYSIILLLIGVFLGYGAALPFFGNNAPQHRLGFQDDTATAPKAIFDTNAMFVPANLGVGMVGAPAEQNTFISSSASDYDSTPSDGGGDTNPTTPTAGPGGSPTRAANANPVQRITKGSAGGLTAGIIIGLAVVVGIAIAVAVYIIKKKG